MAKTTSTTTERTHNIYNNDISFLDYLKPKEREAVLEQFKKMTIDEYANSIGLHEAYKSQDIYDQVYGKGAKAKYEADLLGAKVREAQLAKSFNDSQDAMMYALNSARNDSIATGTNRAMANANALKAILGVQQENVAAATEAAQQYQLAEKDYGVAQAQALADSYKDAMNAQLTLDERANSYWAQQNADALQKYMIDSERNAALYAADAANYGSAVDAALARIIDSVTTSTTTTNTPDPTPREINNDGYSGNDINRNKFIQAPVGVTSGTTNKKKKSNNNLKNKGVVVGHAPGYGLNTSTDKAYYNYNPNAYSYDPRINPFWKQTKHGGGGKRF